MLQSRKGKTLRLSSCLDSLSDWGLRRHGCGQVIVFGLR
jgi:hypothetical protein